MGEKEKRWMQMDLEMARMVLETLGTGIRMPTKTEELSYEDLKRITERLRKVCGG